MRDLGTPVYSKQLFVNMLKQHESANITIVYSDKQPIAVGFTLGWRNTLEIPWASTLRSANPINANMLLYWEILQFAIKQQYQVFDFGRSSKDASTYKFKKQWGAQPHQLYWHYQLLGSAELPKLNPNNPKFKLLIAVWQKLPVWLANLMGPQVVKYLP
jgi:FemAB-related protein (PEP-CTERM system-associated)